MAEVRSVEVSESLCAAEREWVANHPPRFKVGERVAHRIGRVDAVSRVTLRPVCGRVSGRMLNTYEWMVSIPGVSAPEGEFTLVEDAKAMDVAPREPTEVFSVEVAGKCYVQDSGGVFLGKDGRWTGDMNQAWMADDSAHARTVARQQNEKRQRDLQVTR